jgi:hypothetical protein
MECFVYVKQVEVKIDIGGIRSANARGILSLEKKCAELISGIFEVARKFVELELRD